MDISSLLDAAAVIECTGKGMDGFHTNPLSKEYVGPLPKYPGSLPEYPGPLANPPWYELDNVCDQWDKVESFFALYIAPNLDALFALTPGGRFAQMAVMNLTRLSGLSLDGTAAITIPGSNGVAAHYGAPPPTPGLSPKELANITNVAPSSCTTRIGQSLAVLEVVRQLLVLLVPASFVFNNNLIIDESTVGKLEELRISNDYKALRAVFQLLFGTADPGAVSGFLEVADKDNELLTKLGILNTFVVPSTILDTPDLSNPDLSPVFAEMNQANELNTPHSLRPDIVWTLLAWLAQAGAHLSEQELQTSIRYASRELCRTHPKQARIDTGAGSLEMALLLGIHYHLTTRPDPRPDPGYVKSLLLDGTEFWNQNLVMRKLVHLLG